MSHEFVMRNGLRVDNNAIATGALVSPDVEAGGLALKHSSNGKVVTIKYNGFSHGMTDVAETDTYAVIQKEHTTNAGVSLTGLTTNAKAVSINGYATTSYTGVLATSQGAVTVAGFKKSGTGGAALADGDNVFAIRNASTSLAILKGVGDFYLRAGGLKISNTTTETAGMIRWSGSDFEGYSGSEWKTLTGAAGSAAGSDGQVQYNNGGTDFGGAAQMYWDDVNNRLGIGTSTPDYDLEVSGSNPRIYCTGYASNAWINTRRANGTEGTPTAIGDGENLGGYSARGYDGASWISGSYIVAQADGTWSGSNHKTNLSFWTTPELGSSPTERVRITHDGKVTTGAEAAPDVDPGGLCLNHGDNDGYSLTFKNSDVAHSFTGLDEADTYGAVGKRSTTAGGMGIRGYSSSDCGLSLQGIAATPDTLERDVDYGVIRLRVYKSDGSTGVADLADNENILNIANGSTGSVVFVKGSGDIHTFGGIATGGESAPDTDSGGLCLHTGAADGNAITLKSTESTHPFTGWDETDTYGLLRQITAGKGLEIRGYSDNTASGIWLAAFQETPNTGDTDYGVFNINVRKSNGGTSVSSLANTENAISIRNNTTIKAVIKGSGDFVTQAGLKIGSYGQSATAGALQYSGGRFQGYNGSAWKNLDEQAATPTPAGSDGQVQYNNGGSFGGASGIFWDDSNLRVGIRTTIPSTTLDVRGDGLFLYDTSGYNLKIYNGSSGTNDVSVQLNTGNGNDAYLEYSEAAGYRWRLQSFTSNKSFAIRKIHSGGDANVLTVYPDGDSTARIGIKTDSPTERLDVDGAIRIRNTSIASNDGTIRYTSGQFQFRENGNWKTLASSASSPSGSDGSMQYNNGGAFGGAGALTWDDTNSVLIVGSATTSPTFADARAPLQMVGNNNYTMLQMVNNGNDSWESGYFYFKRGGSTTFSSPGSVTSGMALGQIVYAGVHTGGDWDDTSISARMTVLASEDWNATDQGAQIAFTTATNGTTGTQTRYLIGGDGHHVFYGAGTSPSQLFEIDATNSYAVVPSRAGEPTVENGAFFYDTTASAWKFGQAGSWESLAAASVGGSPNQVQFNDGGSFGADANFTWDKTADRLAIGQTTATSTLDVAGDIEIGTSDWHYAGDPSTDGSWRWGLNGGSSLIFQKRETGSWNTKHSLS